MCVRILGVFFIFPNYFLFYSFSPPCGARDGTQSKMLARQVLHHSPIPTALALLIYHHLIFSPSFGSTAVTKTYYKRATSANGTDCVNSTLHTKVCHKMLILEKRDSSELEGCLPLLGFSQCGWPLSLFILSWHIISRLNFILFSIGDRTGLPGKKNIPAEIRRWLILISSI